MDLILKDFPECAHLILARMPDHPQLAEACSDYQVLSCALGSEIIDRVEQRHAAEILGELRSEILRLTLKDCSQTAGALQAQPAPNPTQVSKLGVTE